MKTPHTLLSVSRFDGSIVVYRNYTFGAVEAIAAFSSWQSFRDLSWRLPNDQPLMVRSYLAEKPTRETILLSPCEIVRDANGSILAEFGRRR